MALVFSLFAALLAILVQQWVRDYLHVFQRYSDPLKSARLRQYLHDGCEKWYMPAVAEAVPGLLHVSLFLFFVGLGDFVLNINMAVGVSTSTTVPIGICGILYIFSTFASVVYPQSPYQNSFSGLIWYVAVGESPSSTSARRIRRLARPTGGFTSRRLCEVRDDVKEYRPELCGDGGGDSFGTSAGRCRKNDIGVGYELARKTKCRGG